MALLHDLLASLTNDDAGTVIYPETFGDDILSAYDGDMTGANARVQQLETELANAQAELVIVQAHNYQLIQAGTVVDNTDDVEDENESDTENDGGIDSLFTEKKDS